ncbi:hypothetical protein AMTR_s00052p00057450 [Amborella trichopoda]|uniref:Uncharacterized protein n=1 Tax=Amborella trichopoda TaxID=13333 RepID=U5D7L3_AMBTC|nr:hypothetical protein AMTR_s00052p00057450 [Amborella trichopoda]
MLGGSISRDRRGPYCSRVRTAANVLDGKRRARQQEGCSAVRGTLGSERPRSVVSGLLSSKRRVQQHEACSAPRGALGSKRHARQ